VTASCSGTPTRRPNILDGTQTHDSRDPPAPLLYWKVCSPPEGVGEGDEGQRDDVVHHHDGRVFPPRVHVHRGVDGVAVEAALDQVGDGDVRGHRHATLPVWKAGNEKRDDRT